MSETPGGSAKVTLAYFPARLAPASDTLQAAVGGAGAAKLLRILYPPHTWIDMPGPGLTQVEMTLDQWTVSAAMTAAIYPVSVVASTRLLSERGSVPDQWRKRALQALAGRVYPWSETMPNKSEEAKADLRAFVEKANAMEGVCARIAQAHYRHEYESIAVDMECARQAYCDARTVLLSGFDFQP